MAPLDSLEAALRPAGADAAAIVASQGHYDEQALETILRHAAPGTWDWSRRASAARPCARTSKSAGVPGSTASAIPAGLDLGARTAPEVALSILAEIVQTRPSSAGDACGRCDTTDATQGATRERSLQQP